MNRLTYFAYWKRKGKYGERRIARMLERKDKRYHKQTSTKGGHCRHGGSHWHSCPFQSDMNGNDDPHYCKCCSECRHDCAMDI